MAGEIIQVMESSIVPVDCIILNSVDISGTEPHGVGLDTHAYDGIVNVTIKGGKDGPGRDSLTVGRPELLGLLGLDQLEQVKGTLSSTPEEDISELTVKLELTAGIPEAPFTFVVDYKREVSKAKASLSPLPTATTVPCAHHHHYTSTRAYSPNVSGDCTI